MTAPTTIPAPWYDGMADGWETGSWAAPVSAVLAELVGVGVMASAGGDATYYGGRHRHFDAEVDGVRGDVKLAWRHAPEVIAFGGPGSGGRFDPEKVDQVLLVLLGEPEYAQAYVADGTVRLAATARPETVWRVPVMAMNELMNQDGKSLGRWLLSAFDLDPYVVRRRSA